MSLWPLIPGVGLVLLGTLVILNGERLARNVYVVRRRPSNLKALFWTVCFQAAGAAFMIGGIAVVVLTLF